jgi:hypothetical protein
MQLIIIIEILELCIIFIIGNLILLVFLNIFRIYYVVLGIWLITSDIRLDQCIMKYVLFLITIIYNLL